MCASQSSCCEDVATMDAEIFSSLRRAPSPDIGGWTRRIGVYAWATSRLFEVTGHLARATDDAGTRRRLAAVSSRMAWQAGEWYARLPVLAEVDAASMIRSANPGMEEGLDALGRLAPDRAVDEIVGILEGLDAVYALHAAAASPLSDGAVLRSLARTRADLAAALTELAPG